MQGALFLPLGLFGVLIAAMIVALFLVFGTGGVMFQTAYDEAGVQMEIETVSIDSPVLFDRQSVFYLSPQPNDNYDKNFTYQTPIDSMASIGVTNWLGGVGKFSSHSRPRLFS